MIQSHWREAPSSSAPLSTIDRPCALRNFNLGGTNTEQALWGRNLTDSKMPAFALIADSFGANATFMPARTYGLELNFDF